MVKKITIKSLQKKLWILCRDIVRKRDGNICVCCGKLVGIESKNNWHTGHYITAKTCEPPLRYNLNNLATSCAYCNIRLSGNWLAFEMYLENKHGKHFTESLKAQWIMEKRMKESGVTYKADWYIDKIAQYKEILVNLD